MKIRIAFIGECMVELTRSGAHHLASGFGGDTLNTALYLSRLAGGDIEVSYVTALGTEAFSQEMLSGWQKEGINTRLVQQLPDKNPGLYLVQTDASGERTFSYWRNDSAARYWLQTAETRDILSQLMDYEYLYVSGITFAILPAADRKKLITFLAEARKTGSRIIFDNNYRPRLWESPQTARDIYRQVLGLSDIALLTADDDELLWEDQSLDDLVRRCNACAVRELIIKRGSEPCIGYQNEEQCMVPANSIASELVKDTTAAGDSFNAGYLSSRLRAGSVQNAISRGHLLASTVIQYPGAIIPEEKMPA